MNGYSRAEEIAIGVRGIVIRWGISHSDCRESPLVLFSTGRGSGSEELASSLSATFTLADETAFPPGIVDALARQLITIGLADTPVDAPDAESSSPCARSHRIAHIIQAQIRFFIDICSGAASRAGADHWGVVQYHLPGEYATYLRFLFPSARFLFLRRNPADTYQSFLVQPTTIFPHTQALAVSFQTQCAELGAGFERWHGEVDGLLIDYERLASEDADRVEAFLGATFSKETRALWSSGQSAPDNAAAVEDAAVGRLHFGAPSSGNAPRKRSCSVAMPHITAKAPSLTRESCAILVPVSRYIEPECEESLRALERRGYVIRKLMGCSAVDMARNILATRALDEGFDETFWVDADVAFDPDSVDRLRSHQLPIVSGIYAKKGAPELATGLLPGTAEVVFGEEGGLVEILYAGGGFLYVRRTVYEMIRDRLSLPTCNAWSDKRAIPFFMPMIEQWGERFTYLAEDFGFSRRARQCGFKILADTSIRLWHIGNYRYGYEDASTALNRESTHRYRPSKPS